MKKKSNSQTAYQDNAPSSFADRVSNDHGWADTINRMIEQRYAFLALKYESNGYLFRGMSSGLFNALLENQFWHYSGDESGSHFEQELDVLLVSQDFSDALTVSKLWEQKEDACILVFRSEMFNQALAEKKAAMMATAEPGVVFKYPFLTQPLILDDIEYLIISSNLLNTVRDKKVSDIFNKMDDAGKLLISDGEGNGNRSYLEETLIGDLSKRGVSGAKAINSSVKPKRKA